MKIKTFSVKVGKDAMTRPAKEIWPWELPVLEEKYADVEIYDEGCVERDALPKASDEMARLSNVYGANQGGEPYAVFAYGRGRSGLMAIGKAIKGSVWKAGSKKKAADLADPVA